jgi:predicted AlkP superfamily phosphohydrolase/phosphomutase/tetratricopeptide (TPR) repeat protein
VKRRVLLIGWDAADWKVIHPLIAGGKMPHLQRLCEEGVSGPISTLHPPLSPMLWTSIATGKRPFKHGIHGFSEPTADGRGVQPVTNLSRKTKALWNIFSQSGLRSIVIGWWPSHPAEPIQGVMVSNHFQRARGPLDHGWPLPVNTVHPPDLAETLASLRMHPDLLTPEMVEPFIPLAREIDQDRDERLAMLMRIVAECMSIHSTALWSVDHQAWDFCAVYYDAIDHFCHAFMKYHPPRQSWIGERDFELYHNVISMAYQLQDRMLGELFEKAGVDTNVIIMSDHGFHPDHLRPASIPDIPAGPAIEHRDLGILAISGPGITRGGNLHGSSVLDAAPTILTLFGLPVGEDMDGKVLSRAFIESPPIASIPSWDEVPGNDGCHPPHMRLDPVAAHEALEQLIALGYIERPDADRETAVQKTIRELRYNLAEAYQDAGRHIEAHNILRDLHAAEPHAADSRDQRFTLRLFVSCQALGMSSETRRIVDDLDSRTPVAVYLNAQLLAAEKRYPEALAALERLPETPGLLLQAAELHLGLNRRRGAQHIFEKVLAEDPDNAQAHLGMCRLALQRRKFGAAAQSALDAIERIYHDPLAHYLLGLALTGMKDYGRAAEAFRAAISFNPHFPEAHRRLAALLAHHLGDADSAREHRHLAGRMRNARRTAPLAEADAKTAKPIPNAELQLLPGESLVIVTGLPRSGTSMLMQMLAAGGMDILSDGLREPDEHNPRGYLEFEPVKKLLSDSTFLHNARGRAIKIVAPLLHALPPDLPCRLILIERDLDEVLDSQERMLRRSNPAGRRSLLKEEYSRTIARVKAMSGRPLLTIQRRDAIADPRGTAEKLNRYLGGMLDAGKMAAAVDRDHISSADGPYIPGIAIPLSRR